MDPGKGLSLPDRRACQFWRQRKVHQVSCLWVPALTGIHSRAPEALGLLDPAPLAPHSKFWLPEWALAKRGIWQHERLVLGYFIPRAPSECKVTCQSRPREVSNPGDLEVGVGDGKG